jgi:hypothetical protein
VVLLSLHLALNASKDRDDLKRMLNQQHPLLNALRAQGMMVAGVDASDECLTIDIEYTSLEDAELLKHISVPPREQRDVSAPDAPSDADDQEQAHDGDGHYKNTSPQAIVIRRRKLRNIFIAIAVSEKHTFADVYEHYGSVYGKNRFAVWLWIFESKGWVRYDNGWGIVRDPTDEELDAVTKAYLERHGNYDTPDATCLNDLLRREQAHPVQRNRERVVPKPPSDGGTQTAQEALSWPEMRKAYAQKRAAAKEAQEEPAASNVRVPQNRRFDWPKILDGARDILADAGDPMTATEIQRRLGKDAPQLANLIYYMERDGRFVRGKKKLWTLASEEIDKPEESTDAEPEADDTEEEPTPVKARTSQVKTMLNPEQDEERMDPWRTELGPDKKPYRDED